MAARSLSAYFQCRGNDVDKLRAAIDAIAPRLKAEGLQVAALIMWERDDLYTEREARSFQALCEARADALSPPPAPETKP